MNKLIHRDKTTPLVTIQLIFDRVATHLLTQNRQAVNEAGSNCRYRTSAGLTCAVGCLIDPERYSPVFEGVVMLDLLREEEQDLNESQRLLAAALRESLQIDLTVNLLRMLMETQTIHDFHEERNWSSQLCELAKRLKLSTKAIADWEEQLRHKTQQLLNGCDPV